MAEARRRRRSGPSPRDREATAGLIPQLPWKQPRNPYPPMTILDDGQVEAIHRASLRVLEELGIELMSAEGRALFREAGAQVDEATGVVRCDGALVEQLIATAPSEFTLTSRNPAKALRMGGDSMAFGMVAGPPSVHDAVNGRRSGNMRDFANFTRLAHHFNAVHIVGNQVCAPVELPANTRHLDTYDANVTLSDLCFHVSAIGAGRAIDGIRMQAIARGLSLEEIARSPGVTTIISVNSPRKFDDTMADGLIAMARHGQPPVVTPFTLMGAMTPVTLAAGLAQQNAEALFGIALSQLASPGSPVMYGAYTSNVDMRSGAPAFGTPENAKANVASGQLARRYGLPYRASPTSASNAVDAQAAYETQMALWSCVLGHANLHYHAAGWMEGGLCASYEKFILDVEMLQHMIAFLDPIAVDADTLAFEAMAQVPAGGHFFGSPHTMERYETAFYRPMLSDWTNHEAWEMAGARDATRRATDLWQRALKEYEQPPMDPAIREELDAYVARRKEEIGTGDP